MKLNLNVGHCIGKFFAHCFKVSQFSKRQERIQKVLAFASEPLETRAMMSADPVGAFVAQESPPEVVVNEAMLAEIVMQDGTTLSQDDVFAPSVQPQTVIDYLSFSFDASAEPMTKREARQEAREERREERQALKDDDDPSLSRSFDASARRTPRPKPDKSGLQVMVNNASDGEILPNASENVQDITYINGRKAVTIKSVGLWLDGEGVDDVVAVYATYQGQVIATASPHGSGQVTLGTFNLGILKKDSVTIEIWVTMGSGDGDIQGKTTSLATTSTSVRHPRNSLPLVLLPHNNVTSTWSNGGDDGGGGGSNQIILTESGENTQFSEDGGMDELFARLAQQPAGDVIVNLQSLDTGRGIVGPTSIVFTRNNWNVNQRITVTGVHDFDTVNNTFVIQATSSSANSASVTATSIDAGPGTIVELITTESGEDTQVNETGAGNTDTIMYRLSDQPMTNVTVNIMSTNLSNGTVDKTTLTFTPQNWNTDQIVTVTGVPDSDMSNEMFSVQATSSVGNSTVGVTVIDVTSGAEVQWDVVQFYTTKKIKLIGISGFNPVIAFENVVLRIDINRDGNATEERGFATGDANGGFIVTANGGSGQVMEENSHALVIIYDPAGQGYTEASGVTFIIEDENGVVSNINSDSPRLQKQGQTWVLVA